MLIGIVTLIVFVGATDVINFMDGINGITAGYALAVLVPLLLVNRGIGFVEESLLVVVILGVLVFSFFNFSPRVKRSASLGMWGA